MHVRRTLLALAAIATTRSALAVGPTTQSTPAQQRQSDRLFARLLESEREVWGLPWRLPKFDSAAKVFHLERDNGRLVASNLLSDLDTPARLLINNLRGVIVFKPIGFAIRPAVPDMFEFDERDRTHCDIDLIQTTVSSAAGHLVISRDSEVDEATTSVQLVQDPLDQSIDFDSMPTRVFIKRSSWPDKPDVDLKFEAKTFADLCTEHPKEMSEWVRPIFRDLHQEASTFAPDPKMAWQVLSVDAIPEPALAAKVLALADNLDADHFNDRNVALNDLQALGQPAALVLMRSDRAAMSPERRSSVDTFLAAYLPLDPDSAKQLHEDKFFMLDCLGIDDDSLRKLAWKRFVDLTGTKLTFDPSADPNTRTNAADKIRETLEPATAPSSQP